VLFYRIPAPNEALVIAGAKGVAGAPLRVATGKGVFVWPWRSRARSVSLDLRQAQLSEPCVTKQGITLGVEAVAVFKVGNDSESIINAATRFLDQQDQVAATIGRVLAGHLRSTVGNMTVEEIISSRDTLAQEIKGAASDEMQKMGLDLDAFQIQEITDPSGYIDNIAAPHVAAIQRDARIAKAQADQVAAEKEQQAAALKAQYVRDTEIKQAGFLAEIEQAKAVSAQAGPLAEAHASQEVIQQRTLLAEKEAELTEKKLESEVRRPADAEAYKTRTIAEGERDKTKFETEAEAFKQRTLAEAARDTTKLSTEAEASRRRTLAEADAEAARNQAVGQSEAAKSQADGDAYAQRTVASAEAEAIKVRADALQGDNQALIAANKLVDLLPGLVEAAATGLSGSNLTILNGADGVTELIAGLVGQGLSLYETLRPSIAGSADRGNGADRGTQIPGTGPTDSDAAPPRRVPPRQPRGIADPSPSSETD
jgi:flotillin